MARSKNSFLKLFKEQLKASASLDLRSLALFRVSIAIVILWDLAVRALALSAHYTDYGLLPRSTAIGLWDDPWFFSLHYATGNVYGEAILFAIAGFFALLLLVGYRTRFATFMSWLFLISLQNRNYLVLNSGDVYFRLLLFYAMFLPLGARFSIDRAFADEAESEEKTPNTLLTCATFAVILQICYVYTFAGWIKLEVPEWQKGLGLYYAFSAEGFTRSAAQYALKYLKVLRFANPIVLLMEGFAPLVIFVPWRNHYFRMLGILIFLGFHLFNAIFFQLGFFTGVGVSAWLLLLPTWFWEKAKRPWPEIDLYYDEECSVCLKMVKMISTFIAVPWSRVHTAQSKGPIYHEMQKRDSWVVVASDGRHFEFDALLVVFSTRAILRPLVWVLRKPPFFRIGTRLYRAFADHRPQVAAHFPRYHYRNFMYGQSVLSQCAIIWALCLATAWNLANLPRPVLPMPPPFLETMTYALRLDQNWHMFSNPIIDDGWFVVPAKLQDGTEVDLFRDGAPVDWSKPAVVSATYPTDRWRKYLLGIYDDQKEEYLLNYGRYLCRLWNDSHSGDKTLLTFDIDYMKETIGAETGHGPPEKTSLWSHQCFDESDQPDTEASPSPSPAADSDNNSE